MTVTALPVRDEFTAALGQTIFNYTFLIFTANDLDVYITPAGQEANDSTDITTAYTVDSGTIGNPIGGFITLNSGTASGDLVTIVSSIVDDRTTDYQNSGDFLPDTVNADFDRTVSLVKQQEDRAGRTLAFPQSLQNATALTLSLPAAGLYLAWKADETGVENVGAPGQIIPSEFNGTVLQMVASSTLSVGDFIITSGYNLNADGGDSLFFARATTGGPYDGGSLIASSGDPSIEFVNLFAGGVHSVAQWGAGEAIADNSGFIESAIAFVALMNGPTLFWPDKEYPVTLNVDNLHTVKHEGSGRISRSGEVFHVKPFDYTKENHIYISVTGSTSNDGLTSAFPILYTDIRDVFDNYAPYHGGAWFFEFAAGTYSAPSGVGLRIGSDLNSPPAFTGQSKQHATPNYIVLRGPDVGWDPVSNPNPLPTCIFDGEDGAVTLFSLKSIKAYVQDIKFIDANGSSSSNGIFVEEYAQLIAYNVHTSNCSTGIRGQDHAEYEPLGGIIDGSGQGAGAPNNSGGRANTGFRSLLMTKHKVGSTSTGAVGQGPIIRNCNTGIQVEENSSGHSDFVTYTNNGIGIRARFSSRVNMNGSEFENNNICGQADNGSTLTWADNENLNIGNANENVMTFVEQSTGTIQYSGPNGDGYVSNSLIDSAVDLDNTRVSHTGDTNDTLLNSYTFPRGYLNVERSSTVMGKLIRMEVRGNITSSNTGPMIFRIKIGPLSGSLTTVALLQLDNDMEGDFVYNAEIMIYETSAELVDSTSVVMTSVGSARNKCSTQIDQTAILTAALRMQMRFTSQAAAAADNIDIYSVKIMVAGV